MSLVSACCETTAVLDFGKLIAAGPTREVLRDEHVMRAYLGTEEVAVSEPADADGARRCASTTSTVARGGRRVVHDVSLEIPPGR